MKRLYILFLACAFSFSGCEIYLLDQPYSDVQSGAYPEPPVPTPYYPPPPPVADPQPVVTPPPAGTTKPAEPPAQSHERPGSDIHSRNTDSEQSRNVNTNQQPTSNTQPVRSGSGRR